MVCLRARVEDRAISKTPLSTPTLPVRGPGRSYAWPERVASRAVGQCRLGFRFEGALASRARRALSDGAEAEDARVARIDVLDRDGDDAVRVERVLLFDARALAEALDAHAAQIAGRAERGVERE